MRPIKKLFAPIKVGNVDLKNRILLLGMATSLGEDHRITESILNFYGARAGGGAGLITLGSAMPLDVSNTASRYVGTMHSPAIWSGVMNS